MNVIWKNHQENLKKIQNDTFKKTVKQTLKEDLKKS
jgi:hypothetical protein